jgi:signal transduction histidine kinase/CheY-like chemotaxis protein
MLDKALALCGAAFGVLWRYEGGLIRAVAIRGATSEYTEFLTREAYPSASSGLVLMYGDVTERKRAEAEIHAAHDAAYRDLKAAQANLVQAEKMASLGQLTAGIAHEIKNPLNFVNNFAGLSVELLDELKETAAPAIATLGQDKRAEIDETLEMLTGNLGKIAEHGRRADGIVKSMLEHSRGSSGERRRVNLNALVEEALNLAYHGARAQDQSFNITLERDYAPAIAPIELVPQEITRVCLNLFGNGFYAATKRQKEGGDAKFNPTLKVSTRDPGDAVEFRIRDNGTGISPEIKDKLFQPFFTTKPTGEGTGLGLSISYDIVTQQHGGSIEVDSRVGDFTEFTVRLPRPSGDDGRGGIMSLSILVVDDEPDVADLFRQRFRREARQGTDVMHFAASGAEALDRLSGKIQPTLVAVLSDINMPGMDGLQLLGEIKQRFPDLPVMLVTAYTDDERRRRAGELGASEFISKPVDFDLLKEQLRQLSANAD